MEKAKSAQTQCYLCLFFGAEFSLFNIQLKLKTKELNLHTKKSRKACIGKNKQ